MNQERRRQEIGSAPVRIIDPDVWKALFFAVELCAACAGRIRQRRLGGVDVAQLVATGNRFRRSAWMRRYYRLSRDYEYRTASTAIQLATIQLLLRHPTSHDPLRALPAEP